MSGDRLAQIERLDDLIRRYESLMDGVAEAMADEALRCGPGKLTWTWSNLHEALVKLKPVEHHLKRAKSDFGRGGLGWRS